jgi:hypothetical protein
MRVKIENVVKNMRIKELLELKAEKRKKQKKEWYHNNKKQVQENKKSNRNKEDPVSLCRLTGIKC